MAQRFTIDGSDSLEEHLAAVCKEVCLAVERVVPAAKLDGLVLGGGYGRGQGGVLKTEAGDAPYNDLEFYAFVRGNHVWSERRYASALAAAAEELSAVAGVHVEFKVDSITRLRRSPVSMFSYDLLSGHKLLLGGRDLFSGCEHHLDAARIPLSEGTRLLLNRCTGLLLARELLAQASLTAEQRDFIARNIAKAKLALGDAVLAVLGEYHWSCLERKLQLSELQVHPAVPWLEQVRAMHAEGVAFKLHPTKTDATVAELEREHAATSQVARELWLWLEKERLKVPFASAKEYALYPVPKDGRGTLRNLLLNLRSFGLRAAFSPRSYWYPRERLFRALPLLLWSPGDFEEPRTVRCLQEQLETRASEWSELVAVYKQVWPSYG